MEGFDTGGTRATSRAQRKARGAEAARAWRRSDLVRQFAVVVAVCIAVIAGALGAGVLGGPSIRALQGGALDADATLLAPARPAFWIWSAIGFGLLAYAVWQVLPRHRANARQRAVGWWIAGTVVLDGVWLLAARYGALWTTVVVILALAVTLGLTLRRAARTMEVRSPWLDLVLVDGVTGLHLGWVSVAAVANVTAWLATFAPQEWVDRGVTIAIALLVIVAAFGLVVSGVTGWRIAAPWGMAWGVAWIAVGRLAGEPASTAVGATAVVVAGILFALPLLWRVAAALRTRD